MTFEPSAANLPQDEIRAAIARELGVPLGVSGDFSLPILSIGVEATQLVLRFRDQAEPIERRLPLPLDRSQIAVTVSLIAGNLARDQRGAVRADPAATTPVAPSPAPALPAAHPPGSPASSPVAANPSPAPVPPASPAPNTTLDFKRHWFGVHVAQDVMLVGGENVCTPNDNRAPDFACYFADTELAYFGTPHPPWDRFDTRLALATTRVLLSYDYAFTDRVSLGGRVGYAFGGGPPANPRNHPDPALRGGTPFLPWHLEARGSYWFVPLSNEPWHAFVGGGLGMLQVDAPTTIEESDCSFLSDPEWTGVHDADVFNACAFATAPWDPTAHVRTDVTAWKKTGRFMASVHTGATYTLFGDVEAMLNLNVMVMFPQRAVVFEPSVGIGGL